MTISNTSEIYNRIYTITKATIENHYQIDFYCDLNPISTKKPK